MSQLSEAMKNITGAAADLRETAAILKRVSAALETEFLPQATATLKKMEAVADSVSKEAVETTKELRAKALALIGHVGADAEKLGAVIAKIEKGEWLEAEGVVLGTFGPVSGRVHLESE